MARKLLKFVTVLSSAVAAAPTQVQKPCLADDVVAAAAEAPGLDPVPVTSQTTCVDGGATGDTPCAIYCCHTGTNGTVKKLFYKPLDEKLWHEDSATGRQDGAIACQGSDKRSKLQCPFHLSSPRRSDPFPALVSGLGEYTGCQRGTTCLQGLAEPRTAAALHRADPASCERHYHGLVSTCSIACHHLYAFPPPTFVQTSRCSSADTIFRNSRWITDARPHGTRSDARPKQIRQAQTNLAPIHPSIHVEQVAGCACVRVDLPNPWAGEWQPERNLLTRIVVNACNATGYETSPKRQRIVADPFPSSPLAKPLPSPHATTRYY